MSITGDPYIERERYVRRIAAIDSAVHGYWEGPPEVDGVRDPIIERILEMRQAWLGLYHTTVATEKIRRDHAQLMNVIEPDQEEKAAGL